MRIIVSDTSCLIDLQKGGLLRAIFELPYSFIIPLPLYEGELTTLSDHEKSMLLEAGMEVVNLPGEQVARAAQYSNENPGVSLNDCFAYVLAEDNENAVLFTGDSNLRKLAEGNGIEARGVIWAIDELEEHTDTPLWLLYEALEKYLEDEWVWLPPEELNKRIRRLKKLL